MIERLKSWLGIFPTFGGIARSSQWPRVRAAFLKTNPLCAVCEKSKECEVHHIRPYHLHPDLELDPSNFITLCRDHHFLFGHLMSWASFNESVAVDARIMRDKIKTRP